MSTNEFDPKKAPPGIQQTVDLFVAEGFTVIAADDEQEHDCGNEDCEYMPFIAMRVPGHTLSWWAKQAVNILHAYNVHVQAQPTDEESYIDASAAVVTASYCPVSDEAIVSVFNINDKRMGLAYAQNN